MKKTLLFFCLCLFFTGCNSIEKVTFISNNNFIFTQRIVYSALSEKEREFFNSALIFRSPQTLYGKTVKQIIEEERYIVEKSKQKEKNFNCFEHNFQVKFPDNWKIPTQKLQENSILERYNLLKGNLAEKNIGTISLIIEAIPDNYKQSDFSNLPTLEQKNILLGIAKFYNQKTNFSSSTFLTSTGNNSLILTYEDLSAKFFKAYIIYNQKLFVFTTKTTDKTDRHLSEFIEVIKSFKPLYSLARDYEQTY